jgi:hypothetical protein
VPGCRIFIENPPPFKQAPRGERRALVAVPIEEGVGTARYYLDLPLRLAGLHHSDLDRYEVKRRGGITPSERYDSFDYAHVLKRNLHGFCGVLVPHRVVVYEAPEAQEPRFRSLVKAGITSVVLVGKPYNVPPEGSFYRTSVEDMLTYLRVRVPPLANNLGVIGIHARQGEPERIVNKFEAAGGQLRVMGQFMDNADAMIAFIDRLAQEFERRHLELRRVEWNVGLAIFALKKEAFYATLLRQDSLACRDRFQGLESVEARNEPRVRRARARAGQAGGPRYRFQHPASHRAAARRIAPPGDLRGGRAGQGPRAALLLSRPLALRGRAEAHRLAVRAGENVSRRGGPILAVP